MATRDDVARMVGVSGATVSYVLNNTPGVRIGERTREAVRAAAATLGYRCSQAARSLATGRFNQIGVLAPGGDVLFTAYHERVVRGIWRAATAAGCRVVIDALRPNTPISYVTERFVDGFIAIAPPRSVFTESVREVIARMKLPAVMIGGAGWMQEMHTIDIDNEALGRVAAAHFIEHGHCRMAILGGNEQSDTADRRRRGFTAEIARHGLTVPTSLIRGHGYLRGDAYRDGLEVLQQGGVTAVFCLNDYIALDVLQAARELDIMVPDTLSLIGVDDTEVGEHTMPPLTTFRQPLVDMGETAVHLLLDPPDTPTHRLYTAELVRRHSVARHT